MNQVIVTSNIPIDTLKYLQTIDENIEAMKYIVDLSNSTIANEISAVNTLLVSFTIVFSILGILLGLYISWLQRKVSNMNINIGNKEKEIIKLANKVVKTENMIKSDISGLYNKLRKEETISLLKRLELEPMDITNIGDLLLARHLEDDCFPLLKNAFLRLLSLGEEADEGSSLFNTNSYRKQFLLLFFQHYMYFSIQDDDLRDEIVNVFEFCMRCAFKRDIIKSTEDFCKALAVSCASFDKKVLLTNYLKALNKSKFSNLVELKNIFQENVNKDLLVEAIDTCTSDKIYLKLFGVEAPIDSEGSEIDDSNE